MGEEKPILILPVAHTLKSLTLIGGWRAHH